MKQILLFILVIHLTAALLTTGREGNKDLGRKQTELLSKMIGQIAVDPTMGATYEQNDDNHYLDIPIDDHLGLRAELAAEASGRDKHFRQPKPLTTKKSVSPQNVAEDYDSPDQEVEEVRRKPGKTVSRSVHNDYEYTDGDEIQDIGDHRNLMKPSQTGKRVSYRRNHRDKARSNGRRASLDETEDYDSLDYGETDQNLVRDRKTYIPQSYEDDYYDVPEVKTRRKSRKRQRKGRKGKKNRKDRFRDVSYDYDDLHDDHDHGTRTVPGERTYDFDAYDQLGNPRSDYEDFEDYSPKRHHHKSKRRRGRKFYRRERPIPNYSPIYDDDSDESFEDYGDLRWAFRGDNYYGRERNTGYFDQNHHLYPQHGSNFPVGRTTYASRDGWPPRSDYHNLRPGELMELPLPVPVSTTTARSTVDRIQTTETPPLNENSEDSVDRVHNEKDVPMKSTSSNSDLLPGFTPPEGVTYDIHDISTHTNPEQSVPNHNLDYPVDVEATGSETLDWDVPVTPTTRKPVKPLDRSRYLSPVEYPVDEDTYQGRRYAGNTGYKNVFDQQGRSMMPPAYPDYDYNDQIENAAQATPAPNPYHRRVPQYRYDRTSIFDSNAAQRTPQHHTLQNPFSDIPYDPLDFLAYMPRVREYKPLGVAFPSAQTPWDPNRNFRARYLDHHPNMRSNFMGRSSDYNLDPLFPDEAVHRQRFPYADRDYDFSDNALDLLSLPNGYNTDY